MPEPLIPANRITKGFESEAFICSRKFGGLIRRDSIADFSSFARFTSFVGFPIKDFVRDFSIASTVSYATLFWRRIIWSSWNRSSNFSWVRVFWNFENMDFFGVMVFASFSWIGFSVSFSIFFLLSFLVLDFFGVSVDLLFFSVGVITVSSSSLLLDTQFLSFSFSLPNMVL